MNLHARLGTVLTAGLVILILNAYAVVNGHWDRAFDHKPTILQPNTAAELASYRLPAGAS